MNKTDWSCPGVETGRRLSTLNQETAGLLCDPVHIVKLAEPDGDTVDGEPCILPVWQNIEALVYGTEIINDGSWWLPHHYCVKGLEDIAGFHFNLLDSPVIQATLKAVEYFKDRQLIFEIEAPFTVLSALMNPMELMLCFEEEGRLLTEILQRIADAEVDYVKAVLKKGCRVISLADPTGTMDIMGNEYFEGYSGKSEHYLMKKLDGFLDQAVVHVCKRMSLSLQAAGLVEIRKYQPKNQLMKEAGYCYESLLSMASDPGIHFIGMTCIHHRMKDRGTPYILQL